MPTNDLLIFGTSGFAREVRDIADALGRRATFIARDTNERDQSGLDRVIVEAEIKNYPHHEFVIGIGENKTRKRISEKYAHNLRFVNLIHPSATFGHGQRENIDQQRGIIICAGSRLTNGIAIGNFTILNLNSTVGHDVLIGDYVNIAPGANISGNVQICQGAWIGTNATVNQGTPFDKLTIGEDTVIGSGAVVTKNCDAHHTYIGMPAKKMS